jgi:hypothetical protein
MNCYDVCWELEAAMSVTAWCRKKIGPSRAKRQEEFLHEYR